MTCFTVKCNNAKLMGETASLLPEKYLDGIHSIVVLPNNNQYLIFEAENSTYVKELLTNLSHIVRTHGSIVWGKIDLDKLLARDESLIKELKQGMRVWIRQGAFKGSQAKVLNVDERKETVTVTLLDSPSTIPMKFHAEKISIYSGK